MDLYEAESLARSLMTEHGVADWTFRYEESPDSYSDRCLGRCYYRERVICLSVPYTERNGERVVRDTILHEIAHALTPADCEAHGPEWEANARRLGCVPAALSNDAEEPEWFTSCPVCGRVYEQDEEEDGAPPEWCDDGHHAVPLAVEGRKPTARPVPSSSYCSDEGGILGSW